MPTNIADEFDDIAKRLKSITGEGGRAEPNKANIMYWCYVHGTRTKDRTEDHERGFRICQCSRPVIRYCDSCGCTGWDGDKECRGCNNPFDMKNPNE